MLIFAGEKKKTHEKYEDSGAMADALPADAGRSPKGS